MRKRKDLSAAIEMYERGLSIGDVAIAFGVTRQSMWKCLRRRGVKMRKRERFAHENTFYRGGTAKNINWVLQKAQRKGLITVGPCEVCGLAPAIEHGRQRIHAHHDDYNFPLRVRWLCYPHHFEWHKTHRAKSSVRKKRTAEEIGRIGGLAAQAKLTPEERARRMLVVRKARACGRSTLH